ncbi:MAG: T9SS type A sorting domain-containing protein, partial [Methanoregulaceae archaeon]|nr:T9SS type A sorting domain-containing protein [Methanoregulaceae archaeon]
NNDQHYELIAAGWYKMKALSDSGTVVWNYTIPDYASCFRGVSVSDINGDSTLEVVFGTSEGKVIALNGQTGSKLWILDLAADYGDTLDIDHAPVIGDFDQDGKLDGFVAGGFTAYPNISDDYGRGYAFSLGEGTGPAWPMFQHDLARSSRLPLDWATGIRGSWPALPVVKVAPNPFRDELRIRVEISSPSHVTLELCDLYGRVLRSRREFQRHPDNVYVWSGLEALSPGFYLLKVTAGSFPRTFRVISGR